MDTITVLVGTLESLNNGQTQDGRREVSFEGEKLGSECGYGRPLTLDEALASMTGPEEA